MKAAVFADYTGLSVVKMTELRKRLKSEDAEMKVVKKTLVGLALKNAKIENTEIKKLPGQLALIFGYRDEISPAKLLYNFGKKDEHLKIIGGILGGNFLTSAKMVELAKLPTLEELLTKAVGSIAAPLSGMLNVLQGNLRGLVYILAQIKR